MARLLVHQAESISAPIASPFSGKGVEIVDAVRRRAYQLFEQRGRAAGGHLDDWLQAEK